MPDGGDDAADPAAGGGDAVADAGVDDAAVPVPGPNVPSGERGPPVSKSTAHTDTRFPAQEAANSWRKAGESTTKEGNVGDAGGGRGGWG